MPIGYTRQDKVHAFLILAHKDPQLVELLVETLNPLGRIYLHVDRKPMDDFSSLMTRTDISVTSQVNVKWGHWSMVEATLLLIETAMKDGADRFTLISGDALPIVSGIEFNLLLNSSIDICHHRQVNKDSNPTKDSQYFCRYFASKKQERIFPRAINTFLRIWPIPINVGKYLYPLELHKGSQYWSITKDTMQRMLEHHIVHPHFATYFRKTKLSDETFFQTLAVHYSDELNGTGIMYANWSAGNTPHPGELDATQIQEEFESQKFLFARKFSSSNPKTIDKWRAIFGTNRS